MVRTQAVGKRRPFWRGLLLTVATFGIYGVYWSYKAPNELYKQFELHNEGRDDGVVWLVLGLLLPFLIFVYQWKAVANTAYIRKRLDVPGSLTPTRFIGYEIGGGLIAGVSLLAASGIGAAGGVDWPTMLGLAVLGQVVGLGLQAYAYYRWQHDINETWDAWRERRRELTSPSDVTFPVVARASGPGDA